MAKIRSLTDGDIKVIRGLIAADKRVPRKQLNVGEVEGQASDVYIAKPTDVDGIPALTLGTGANPDIPGYADCDIYTILIDDVSGNPELIQLGNVTQRVYNISTSVITQDEWIIIQRDKFGRWVPAKSSGGCNFFYARITDRVGSCYSWVEAEPASGGTCGTMQDVAGGMSGTANLFDINAASPNIHLSLTTYVLVQKVTYSVPAGELGTAAETVYLYIMDLGMTNEGIDLRYSL